MQHSERRFAKALRVRVSRGLYDHVDKLAADLGVSRSEILRNAIRRGVVFLEAAAGAAVAFGSTRVQAGRRGVMMRRVVAVGVCVAVLGVVAGAQEPAQEDPPPRFVPAAVYFPSELIDWAELYANPVLEIEPVGFGAVAFERRSFERSVASLVLVAAATCGVYVGLRSGLRGEGWARAVAVAAPSGIGVTAGVQGFTRWSQVPAVRRVGW